MVATVGDQHGRTMPVARRGGSLIELLVALPITALLAAAAAGSLIAAWRVARASDAALTGAREFRHAQAALEADLRPLQAADLHDVRDTMLEFDALLGVGVICAAAAGTVDVIPIDRRDAHGLSWATRVLPSDPVVLWHRDPRSTTDIVPVRTAIVSLQWGASCSGVGWTHGWSDQRAVRLTLPGATAPTAVVGSPVVIKRRTRYSLYRSGSSWFLGRRTQSGAGWEVIQPVAGPFLSSTSSGMSMHPLDQYGIPTAVLTSVAAIRISLRSTRRAIGHAPATRDSATFDVVLRAESAQRGR
jgi:hypothetical protein